MQFVACDLVMNGGHDHTMTLHQRLSLETGSNHHRFEMASVSGHLHTRIGHAGFDQGLDG